MSSVMQSKDGTNVCLILVNFQKEDKHIIEELGYWFSYISHQCVKLKDKCKVLTIGSHADLVTKVEAKRKAALVSEFTKKYLSDASRVSIEVVKSKVDLIINCCKPRSSTCIHSALKQIVDQASTFCLSEEAAILLGLLEKDFKNVVACRVQTLLMHIMETGVYLPNAASSLYGKIMELHTVGILMIVGSQNNTLEDYMLILNVPKLTNEVHRLLFSKKSAQQFLSSTNSCSASMGIFPQTYLNGILPEYITTECLVQLQYCQEFSDAEVKFDYSVIPTEDSSAPTFFYFPALCSTDRRESISLNTPEGYNYRISWYLKCGEMFDYLPPRFLHVLLLRLANSFALPAAYDHSSMKDNIAAAVRLYNRRCTMWKNGIHWLMEEGIECFIENVNNSKGIVVIAKSEEIQKLACTEMLFKVIKEIYEAKEEFCGTVTFQEYLMDSDDPNVFTDEDKLYLVYDVARVIKEEKPYVISASGPGHTQLKVARISHLSKYLFWDAEKDQWTLASTKQAEHAIPSAIEEVDNIIKLSEDNHSVLYEKLAEHSSKWWEVGVHLGFRPSELDDINSRPLLLSNAPKSWCSVMLAEWLQWAPGDKRKSSNFATLEGLKDALDKAGLSECSQSIMTLEFK